MSNSNLTVHFLLQIALILAACRGVGLITRRIGQPQVIGEMIAGIMLGPSLLGLFLPGLHGLLFPQPSLGIIHTVSHLGLVLYMFLVGLEFNVDLIKSHLRSAAIISVTGILVPFTLGSLTALLLINNQVFFAEGVPTVKAMLFLGAAMSVTAFPTLARILDERGLKGTVLGTLTLAAGSMDDAAAWCILALLPVSSSGSLLPGLYAVGGGAIYTLFVLLIGKRLLSGLGQVAERKGVGGSMIALVLFFVMLSAWCTSKIGIYEVFGAFILGVAMPRGVLTRGLYNALEPVTVYFLVPLFFVYSGLNTRIGLIDTPYLLVVTLFILAVACLGKGVACWLAARLNGEDQRDALAIGALMNARGLMELIILNIGLEQGIITPTLFTIMVIMAITTTLLATPVFEFIYRFRKEAVIGVSLTR